MAAALTITNIPVNGMGGSQQILNEDAAQCENRPGQGSTSQRFNVSTAQLACPGQEHDQKE